MSKAILVMDMPSSCRECSCISLGCCNAVGGVGFCRTIGDIYDKPDWCPLKPMPSKKDKPTKSESVACFNSGYNACIDEILEVGAE